MSREIPARNLRVLVDRVFRGAVDYIVTLETADIWLETFLNEWVLEEERFFFIALEKEELDMYNRALSLHLIGEDEVTQEGFILDSYHRPSVIREAAKTAQAKGAAEQREIINLKERRSASRQSLARTDRLLHSLTSKLADLKIQVDKHDRKLVELNRDCDTLISACAQTTIESVDAISTEFSHSIQSSGLLQKLSVSLQNKYQFIEGVSNKTLQGGASPEEFRQASWMLSRAFRRLEERLHREELLKMLDDLSKETPRLSTEANNAEKQPSSPSATVVNRLQNAWRRDEMIKLSCREEAIHMTAEVVRTQILPPLTLLYSGLRNLQTHVSNVHAQCVVLLSEFQRLAQTLQEVESQALLNEEDELLIRLSTLLGLDPGVFISTRDLSPLKEKIGEQGELSADAVLDKIAKLKLEG